MPRGLVKDFLAAMREKLELGRRKGREGWDSKWNCSFQVQLRGAHGYLMAALQAEVIELALAIHHGNRKQIRLEAADVANFAMMMADIEGALESSD